MQKGDRALDWIRDDLAIGNLEDALSAELTTAHGVRAVLTLSAFPNLAHAPVEWRNAPLIDGPGNPHSDIHVAVEHLSELHTHHAPVLVHCSEGKSRSALIVAIYLTALLDCSFAEAYALIRERRSVVDMDDALWELGSAICEATST